MGETIRFIYIFILSIFSHNYIFFVNCGVICIGIVIITFIIINNIYIIYSGV